MTAVPAEERAVDLVLDAPEIDVEEVDLERDEPIVPPELLLDNETRATLRRLIHDAREAHLKGIYGENYHKNAELVECHGPWNLDLYPKKDEDQ